MKAFEKFIVCVLVAAAIGALAANNVKLSKEIERLSNNQEVLLSDMEVVTDKYNREVSKVGVLELKASEMKQLNEDALKTIEALKLKARRLEGIISTTLSTVDTVFVDMAPATSIDTTSVLSRDFQYSDPFAKIQGRVQFEYPNVMAPARVQLSYEMKDTLDVIIYRVPKRFLGIIPHGVKHLDCYLNTHNPHSKVVVGSCVLRKQRK